MVVNKRSVPSINQVQNQYIKRVNQPDVKQQGQTFQQVLDTKLKAADEIKFSKHANMRLNARNISFTKAQMTKLNQGIDNAMKRGIKESLVLMDDVALVVNVKNKTVVTAMEKNETSEQIFTNIDGAVLL